MVWVLFRFSDKARVTIVESSEEDDDASLERWYAILFAFMFD